MQDVTESREPGLTENNKDSTVVGKGRGTKTWMRSAWEMSVALLRLIAEMLRGSGLNRKRKVRPWNLFVTSKDGHVTPGEIDRDSLVNRHRALGDLEKIAEVSSRFRTPEGDFFADPKQIERLIEQILAENPPWLHVNRVLAGGDGGAKQQSIEYLYREQEVREYQDAELFQPDDSWKDRPLASLTMRPAHSLSEVWHARLLDQILPPTVLLDRCNRGEIMIPIHDPIKQRLNFRNIERRLEVVTRKLVPVPVETEGGEGTGGQLLYILLDFSASMQGSGAVLAMAVISATIRAHLGEKSTRYLFRRFSQKEALWPNRVERPKEARTLQEKDRLLDIILATNFNGSATDINDALTIAAQDIEKMRQKENLEAEILLVTDGRAEMIESTRLNLLRARAKVHTVMVVPEPNPELELLSESYTAMDVSPDLLSVAPGIPTAKISNTRTEQHYRI